MINQPNRPENWTERPTNVQHSEALQMNRAHDVQSLGAMSQEDLANQLLDLKEQNHSILERFDRMEASLLTRNKEQEAKTSRCIKIAGVFGVIAVAAFAANFIGRGNDDNEKVVAKTIATQTSTAKAAALTPSVETTASTSTTNNDPMNTPAPKASEATKDKAGNYDLNGAKNVNNAITNLKFSTAKGAVTTILGNPTKYDGLKVSNKGNRQSDLEDYDKNIATANVAEGWALSVINSKAFSQSYLNAFERKNVTAERTDTHQEQIAKINKIVSSEGTTFDGSYRMNGTWRNANTNDQTKVVGAHVQNFNNIRALQIVPGNKKYVAAYAKIGGGNNGNELVCLNANQLVAKRAPNGQITFVPAQPSTPNSPNTTPQPKRKIVVSGPVGKIPQTPGKFTPNKPVNPKTPETPETPTPPKHDKNTTPAGVPGQNGGTPDVAGVGPAGQTPDASSFLPTESRPATPAPEPTPAPLHESGPEPTAPAVTGDLTPPTTPPVQGNGAEAPTPTDDVVINP